MTPAHHPSDRARRADETNHQVVQALGAKTRSVVERGVVLGVVVALAVGVGATLALDALGRASSRA